MSEFDESSKQTLKKQKAGEFSVGQRVADAEGFRGTVRYIGPVAASKKEDDVWLGVEWDKDSRGKHDGACTDANGLEHRYFTCAPGSGSFVKPTKIHSGRTLVEALSERYVGLDAPLLSEKNVLPDSFVVTAKGERKAIEFVGESSIRKHQQLSEVNEVSVRNCEVCEAGHGLGDLIGHVRTLDLQDNLFSAWSDVGEISKQISGLQSLLLHGNKIGDVSNAELSSLKDCFGLVKIIALNMCGIKSWDTVKSLHSVLPSVTELYLAANTLQNLTPTPSLHFPQLTVIDLSSCSIVSWKDVVGACGSMPALQVLVLDLNPIEAIQSAEDDKFVNLKRISLANSMLNDWSDINALATYAGLASLRLTGIPLFKGKGPSEVRPEVIARLSQLQTFNGSKVSPKERIESEKIYLRKMLKQKRVIEGADAQDIPSSLSIDFDSLHPRFAELNQLYGPDVMGGGDDGSTASLANMASDMVSLTFHNLSFASGGSMEPQTRRIPASIKVDKLRLMVKQLFGLEAHRQQLSIRQFKGGVPTLLDEDDATIGYFGAIDGAEIFINETKE